MFAATKATIMINGFPEETADLTTEELIWAQIIAKTIASKVGADNAVTNETISAGMANSYGVRVGAARIRKIINYIRRANLVACLVATSRGYYVENDLAKLDNYIESLHQRADAILAVAAAVTVQKNKLKNELTDSKKNISTEQGDLFACCNG